MKEVSKIVIGDRGSDSQALSDPKAILFDKGSGLLVLPILEAKTGKLSVLDASTGKTNQITFVT